ncbi:MAG: VanZ family protein [Candidatus Methylomirabilia bacterium]
MRRARWAVLALYTAGIFLSLPYTPRLVKCSNARFGPEAAIVVVGAVLALAGALLVRRLLSARAAFPWPHLALAALGLASWAAWHLLASSPIGRVHLPEYGLLALLAGWAVGGGMLAALGSGIAAAGVGFLDELLQEFTPGRVFDWWDVALNVAAALLGGLSCAWWRWTGKPQP